jgi:hypothetical protein
VHESSEKPQEQNLKANSDPTIKMQGRERFKNGIGVHHQELSCARQGGYFEPLGVLLNKRYGEGSGLLR